MKEIETVERIADSLLLINEKMNLPAESRRGINNIFSTRNAASCWELTLKEIKLEKGNAKKNQTAYRCKVAQ